MQEQETVEALLGETKGQKRPWSEAWIAGSEPLLLLKLDALVGIATSDEDFLTLLPLGDEDNVSWKVIEHELVNRSGFNLIKGKYVWIMFLDCLCHLERFVHLEVLDVPRKDLDAIQHDALLSAVRPPLCDFTIPICTCLILVSNSSVYQLIPFARPAI
jgi:hypothetical protein